MTTWRNCPQLCQSGIRSLYHLCLDLSEVLSQDCLSKIWGECKLSFLHHIVFAAFFGVDSAFWNVASMVNSRQACSSHHQIVIWICFWFDKLNQSTNNEAEMLSSQFNTNAKFSDFNWANDASLGCVTHHVTCSCHSTLGYIALHSNIASCTLAHWTLAHLHRMHSCTGWVGQCHEVPHPPTHLHFPLFCDPRHFHHCYNS